MNKRYIVILILLVTQSQLVLTEKIRTELRVELSIVNIFLFPCLLLFALYLLFFSIQRLLNKNKKAGDTFYTIFMMIFILFFITKMILAL